MATREPPRPAPGPTVHCHVPITIRLTGVPNEATLAALRLAVERNVRDRLATAQRILADPGLARTASRRELKTPLPEQFNKPLEANREHRSDHDIPASERHHIPAPIKDYPTVSRNWHVLRALQLRAGVTEFLDIVDRVHSQDPGVAQGAFAVPGRLLYQDLTEEERELAVWLVQVDAPMTLGELSALVSDQAARILPVGPGETMVTATCGGATMRSYLGTLDPSGQVAALPSMAKRNARRVTGAGQAAQLLPGSWLIWAGMVIPQITPTTLLDIGPLTTLLLPLTDAAAAGALDPAEFPDRIVKVPWEAYSNELGNRGVRVDVLPLRTHGAIDPTALDFAARAAMDGVSRPSVNTEVVVHRRVAQTDQPGLPNQIREVGNAFAATHAQPGRHTDQLPTHGQPTSQRSTASAGTALVVLDVHFPADTELLRALTLRPLGRQLAAEVRDLLSADSATDLGWKFSLHTWLDARLGAPPAGRPAGGTPWEYGLAELQRSPDLNRLFNAVQSADWPALTQRLLQHSMATNFEAHPRVRALLDHTRRRGLDPRQNEYLVDTDRPAVIIDRDQRMRLTVGLLGGNVMAELSTDFLHERTEYELNPSAMIRLRDALETQGRELIARIASSDPRQLHQDQFLRETVAAAAQHAQLTQDDWHKEIIQRSQRLLDVRYTPWRDIPRWEVTLIAVERRAGTRDWTEVGTPFTRTDMDLEADITYMRRAGAAHQIADPIIGNPGHMVVAWDAGIIAALVVAARGDRANLDATAISKLMSVIRAAFNDADLSAEGFLKAAVDGYLTALGFRGVTPLTLPAGKSLDTVTLRRTCAAIISEKLITGSISPNRTGLLTQFAADVVDTAVRTGQLSNWQTHVANMSWTTAAGILSQFTTTPLLPIPGSNGRLEPTSAADLVSQLKADGYTLAQYGAAATQALSNLQVSAALFANDDSVTALLDAFGNRVEQILTSWAASVTAKRVLELSGTPCPRQAVPGLERFLTAADQPTSAETARRLAARFTDQPQASLHLMEVLSRLEPTQVSRIMTGNFSSDADLAALLAHISRYDPDQQRAIIDLLSGADVVRRPAHTGTTLQQTLDHKLQRSLLIQAAMKHHQARQLIKEAQTIPKATTTAEQTKNTADRLRDEARTQELSAAKAERIAAQLSQEEPSHPREPGGPAMLGEVLTGAPDEDAALLPEESDAAGSVLHTGTEPRHVWIQLPAQQLDPKQVEMLCREMFTSRSGNPVVFHVEAGTEEVAERSQQFIRVDPGTGQTRIRTDGQELTLNAGSLERAIEFMIESRPGSGLVVFEIDAGYLRNLRLMMPPDTGSPTFGDPPPPPGAAYQTPEGRYQVQDSGGNPDLPRAGEQLQLDASTADELNDFIVSCSGRVLRFAPLGSIGRMAQ